MTRRTVLLAGLLLLAQTNLLAQAPVKALVGGTLVNTNGEAPRAATLLLRDSLIVEVGPPGQVRIPQGAEVIDLQGKWIIPGLIDAHVHFFQSGGLYTRPDFIDLRTRVPYEEELQGIWADLPDTFARYLRSGVTSVVDVGGPLKNFEIRDLAGRTELAPRVAVAGPLVSTYQPPELTTSDPPIIRVTSPEEALALVRREAAWKPDLIKIWGFVLPGQQLQESLPLLRAAIEESHRHGIRVAVHATELETARAAVQAGADVLVHSVTDRPVDEAFVRLLKERDVVYTTTLVVLEGIRETFGQAVRLSPAEQEIADPFIVSTLFDLRRLPEELAPKARLEALGRFDLGHAPENLKALQDAGVTIALGTDAGNIGTPHGPSIYREMELMAEAGLTPLQILTAATAHGARVMGRERQLGTVEPGKLADLVVLNSDPLADIRHVRDVSRVVKNGKVYAPGDILRKSPVDVVQQQVNAYNARDIEGFLATYSPAIELYAFPDSLLRSGLESMRASYGRLFDAAPALHVEITDRIVAGNRVIDRERVTGLPNGRVLNAVAIYEVQDGLIRRVWFIRE